MFCDSKTILEKRKKAYVPLQFLVFCGFWIIVTKNRLSAAQAIPGRGLYVNKRNVTGKLKHSIDNGKYILCPDVANKEREKSISYPL